MKWAILALWFGMGLCAEKYLLPADYSRLTAWVFALYGNGSGLIIGYVFWGECRT